jgi:hypothetical protein
LYDAVKPVVAGIGVLSALVVGSCHRAPLRRPESKVPQMITLERTVCFGSCPAYQLSVTRTGSVAFISRNPSPPAPTAKPAVWRVAPSVFDSLYARAVRIGFFALPDTLMGDATYCSRRATDMPSATVTINTDTGKKTVVDYHGCGAESPAAKKLRELRIFEAEIDTLTGSSRWIQPAKR